MGNSPLDLIKHIPQQKYKANVRNMSSVLSLPSSVCYIMHALDIAPRWVITSTHSDATSHYCLRWYRNNSRPIVLLYGWLVRQCGTEVLYHIPQVNKFQRSTLHTRYVCLCHLGSRPTSKFVQQPMHAEAPTKDEWYQLWRVFFNRGVLSAAESILGRETELAAQKCFESISGVTSAPWLLVASPSASWNYSCIQNKIIGNFNDSIKENSVNFMRLRRK